jgi:hypothetical protein
MVLQLKFKMQKSLVFLGLEDVLIPGKVDQGIDSTEVKFILEKLREESHPILLTGYSEEIALEKIEKYELGQYFHKDDIFTVDKAYIETKEEEDKKRYFGFIEKDPFFKDEYFKQTVIERFSTEKGIPKGEMVLIGHDLWFDGFYTMRFSKIDFALIESANSLRGEKSDKIIEGVTYINRTWEEVKRLLQGEREPADLKALNKFVFDFLKKQMMDPNYMKVVGKPLPGIGKLGEAD